MTTIGVMAIGITIGTEIIGVGIIGMDQILVGVGIAGMVQVGELDGIIGMVKAIMVITIGVEIIITTIIIMAEEEVHPMVTFQLVEETLMEETQITMQ